LLAPFWFWLMLEIVRCVLAVLSLIGGNRFLARQRTNIET